MKGYLRSILERLGIREKTVSTRSCRFDECSQDAKLGAIWCPRHDELMQSKARASVLLDEGQIGVAFAVDCHDCGAKYVDVDDLPEYSPMRCMKCESSNFMYAMIRPFSAEFPKVILYE